MSYNNQSSNYVGAPYNFVPLYKRVFERYKNIDELPRHDKIYKSSDNEEFYSGEIEYSFKNETDIFISNGENTVDFYKNLKGKYAVPGSTMRGLIRGNMTILGFCSVCKDIKNKKFMYREVGTPSSQLKKTYSTQLGIKSISKKTHIENVKAGYIVKENGKWKLYETVKKITNSDSNFFAVREDYVLKKENISNFKYIKENLMYEKDDFKKESSRNGKGISIKNFSRNKNYRPYFEPISYNLNGNKVIGIDAPNKLENEGYVISTGWINNKNKTFYIIPEIDKNKSIDLDNNTIIYFKDDFKAKETQLGKNKEFFDLPKDNIIKPIFYTSSDSEKGINFNLSFTPMLRVFYNKSIFDGIPNEHKNDTVLDYTNSIFGFTGDKNSYKSRVYFEDAILKEDKKTNKAKKFILGEPKASSYFDYLKDGKNYNDDFEIRGIKQYWLRKDTLAEEPIKNLNVASTIKPIGKGNTFSGKIRFKNLSKDELGLLLWSICLEENCCMNIGMAKSFGFGRIRISNLNLKLYNTSAMYDTYRLNFNIYNQNKQNYNDFIEYYKKYIMENFINNSENKFQSIMDIESVKTFIQMKTKYPDKSSIRYMKIDKPEQEYRNRKKNKKPLDTAEDIIKNIKGN